jgi:hypothetical protein
MKWTVSPVTGTRRDRAGFRVPIIRATLLCGFHPAITHKGEHGKRVLEGVAKRWNATGFVPSVFHRPTCCADFAPAGRQKLLTQSNP